MLDLVNDKGELHPYYLTVKKIIAYSIMMKDEKKQNWPILGICQGIQCVAMYFADDDHKVLEVVDETGEKMAPLHKPTTWAIKDVSESKFYCDFP